MLITIYNIYIDSLIFIKKNLFVVLPYIFWQILNSLLNLKDDGDSLLELFLGGFVSPLIFCFAETIIVIIVYRKEEIIVSRETIWRIFNRFSGNVLLLSAYYAVIFFVCYLIFSAVFVNTSLLENIIKILVVIALFTIYPLSLRHLIYYNINIVVDSIKAGFRELFKHFFFYLAVTLLGIIVGVFPSLFSPSSWFAFPFLPIAELSGLGSESQINWLRLFLDSILLTLTSIALTYAFILKNKKVKHA